MKLKHISYFLFGGAMLMSQSSCDDMFDDFLTQSNPNEMSTDNFWASLSDCNTGLNAVYNAFKSQNIYMLVSDTHRSDLSWPGVSPCFPQTSNVFYLHTFNNANQDIANKWSALYTGIFRANQVIEGLNGIKDKCTSDSDVKSWNLIMGQARFFRGLFHFYASLSFNNGNVPVVDFVPKSEADFFMKSSCADKVKDFVRQDLAYAESVLPRKGSADDWTAANGNLGRVTADAASAVLGISYLYDKDYDKAKELFAKIIDNSHYKLAGPEDNSTTRNEFNSESILEVNYTSEFNNEFSIWSQQILTNTLNLHIAPGTCGGWGPTIYPSYWLYRDFTYEPVDKRDGRNIIYLNTDEHGDIYYNNKKYAKTVTENKPNGDVLTFQVYPVLDTTDMNYYMKKVAVDAEGKIAVDREGNPLANFASVNPSAYTSKQLLTYTLLKDGYSRPLRPYVSMPKEGVFKIYRDSNGRLYRYRNHSLRASYSILMPTENDLPYYGFDQNVEKWPYSNAISAFRKMTNWDIRKSEKDVVNQDSEINFRVIRLADVYLMYAECLIKGGTDESGVPEALKYINRVRQRAGTILVGSENQNLAEFKGICTYQDTPDLESKNVEHSFYHRAEDPEVISTADEVMKHLMYKERPLELCLEGYAIRYMDLRRWGILKTRFEELSKIGFTKSSFTFVRVDNASTDYLNLKSMWTWAYDYDQSACDNALPADKWKYLHNGTFYQYTGAAVNYNDSKAYYPFPSNEIVANPNVIKVIE